MFKWVAMVAPLALCSCVILEQLVFDDDDSRFFGRLAFTRIGCESERQCVLADNFGYVDPFGIAWQAPAGTETDGASIPSFLWQQVGWPYDKDLIRAAVVHDYYCKAKVRPWQQTHRVFYDALITSGVEEERANLLYMGVLVGGPRWSDEDAMRFGGLPAETPIVVEAPVVAIGEAEEEFFVAEPEFRDNEQNTLNDDARAVDEFNELAAALDENPDMTPEEIAEMVAKVEEASATSNSE